MRMRFISQHAILAYLGNAKALAFLVAAYVLSPIELIPDFIPILGYGDDLISWLWVPLPSRSLFRRTSWAKIVLLRRGFWKHGKWRGGQP
jgi:uncharacterized protein DUF1232